STLFNALTKKSVPAENYPFCTIDPSVGIVPVPDARLDVLAKMSNSAKVIPAVVEFVDIAGLVKGASSGEGLGNKFLAHIREVNAIAHMVRVFEDLDIIHVHGAPKPMHDATVINMELILADLETVTKRLGSVEREAKRGEKDAVAEKAVLEQTKTHLESEKPARTVTILPEEKRFLDQLSLLSSKPILYVLNTKEGAGDIPADFLEMIKKEGARYVVLDAHTEQELSLFEGDEKDEMRSGIGLSDDGLAQLIVESYKLLGLATFLTTGEDETRAWTIAEGSLAPVAASAIHTDFEKKFIKAEVVKFEDLARVGSYAKARELGLLKTEGRDYIVQDGDVIEFKVGA
ncbi:MAG: redox-regulated ATPase YchF, partial [Patescibacteria group bacterium]